MSSPAGLVINLSNTSCGFIVLTLILSFLLSFSFFFVLSGGGVRGGMGAGGGSGVLWMGDGMQRRQDQTAVAATSFRRGVYEAVLTKIRLVLITRMAKPEEVLIVEDENGESRGS